MDLKGKNIIVTGGSLGIGKETARLLVEKGANLELTDSKLKTAYDYAVENGHLNVTKFYI